MSRVLVFILVMMTLVVSCTSGSRIPIEASMTAVQDAGYSLSIMNVSNMKCFQGAEKHGASLVFMQVYCAIEDHIDMMNFGINPTYSPLDDEKIREVLDLVGFPRTQEVLDFVSVNEGQLFQGNKLNETIGSWRITASTRQEGADNIVFIGILSQRYLEEVEP